MENPSNDQAAQYKFESKHLWLETIKPMLLVVAWFHGSRFTDSFNLTSGPGSGKTGGQKGLQGAGGGALSRNMQQALTKENEARELQGMDLILNGDDFQRHSTR